MAFNKAVQLETVGLGSGEAIASKPYNTEMFTTFEDGVIQGRFVKYDTGSIDMLDASATPKIAGVVRRKIGGELEVGTYTTASDTVVEVHNFGMVTVDVVSGNTPAKYGIVYAVNASGADAGKATTTATDNVNTGCVFWEQMSTNVWLVLVPSYLK
jgi:major membrane immunogen (membrane-anchored lipoprotein)